MPFARELLLAKRQTGAATIDAPTLHLRASRRNDERHASQRHQEGMSVLSLAVLETLVVDANGIALARVESPPVTILEGTPAISEHVLWRSGNGAEEAGVWEMTPGVIADVEAAELFVVLAGRATVEIEGGPTLELGPGSTGLWRPGERTRWRVRKTLRKVYVITADASAAS